MTHTVHNDTVNTNLPICLFHYSAIWPHLRYKKYYYSDHAKTIRDGDNGNVDEFYKAVEHYNWVDQNKMGFPHL